MLEIGRGVLILENFRFDPVEIDLDPVGHAAVGQSLDQRLVGVLEAGIFADDGDGHLAFGIMHAFMTAFQRLMSGRGAGSMPKAAKTS